MISVADKFWLHPDDARNISTFPQDYDFGNQSAQYLCGMSVAPVMMAKK